MRPRGVLGHEHRLPHQDPAARLIVFLPFSQLPFAEATLLFLCWFRRESISVLEVCSRFLQGTPRTHGGCFGSRGGRPPMRLSQRERHAAELVEVDPGVCLGPPSSVLLSLSWLGGFPY